MEKLEGNFKIPNLFKVDIGAFNNDSKLIEKNFSKFFQCEQDKGKPNIILQQNSSFGVEEYSLIVGIKQISIVASELKGILHGIQTFNQLVEFHTVDNSISCCRIIDSPRFSWRGVHLDVSRHFFPISFIKRFIDIISQYKMNVFHWHLVDDQGWRLEIKSRPELHKIGSTRIEKDGTSYAGFYSQLEIKEVIEYALEKGVEVVPEIEMPGHASSAIASYPELSCKGENIDVPNEWGVFKDVYCAGKESSFEFLEDVLSEVADLFPSKYIHIGGDECPKTAWKVCPYCQRRMTEHNLANEEELQSYFIKRMVKFLKTKGKTAIGWDEILEGGLAEETVVMSWQGYNGAVNAAKNGNKAIMTPTSHCYFDYYQAKQGEPKAFNAYLPLEKVYGFNPIPEELNESEKKLILGGQANLWTEYMPDEKQVEYMLLPRLTAMAEVLWSERLIRDFPEFLARVERHTELWKKNGYNFRNPVHE